ncbi:MAG: hypothetical protein RL726_672, partial [Actinomycetota bacterium]
ARLSGCKKFLVTYCEFTFRLPTFRSPFVTSTERANPTDENPF